MKKKYLVVSKNLELYLRVKCMCMKQRDITHMQGVRSYVFTLSMCD